MSLTYHATTPANRAGSSAYEVLDGPINAGQVEKAPCGSWVALVNTASGLCALLDGEGWLIRFNTRTGAARRSCASTARASRPLTRCPSRSGGARGCRERRHAPAFCTQGIYIV